MPNWAEVRVTCAPEAVEAVSQFLLRRGAGGTEIHDPTLSERHRAEEWGVSAYFPFEAAEEILGETGAFLRGLVVYGLEPGSSASVSVRKVSEEDWAEGWKAFYPVLHIGRRLVIRPPWREYEPREGELVVELDPGMAFGTGMHPTTALALEMLEGAWDALPAFAPSDRGGLRVLDVGTGSGILAIAAAKMGASRVLAVDADAVAVEVARRNIDANRVEPVVEARAMAVGEEGIPGEDGFDLITENTLAEVIARNLPALTGALRAGGRVILSGIIAGKEGLAKEAASRAGLALLEEKRRDGWTGLLFTGRRGGEGESGR